MSAEQAPLWQPEEPSEPVEPLVAPYTPFASCAWCGWLIVPREPEQTLCHGCRRVEHDTRYVPLGDLPIGATFENGFERCGTLVLEHSTRRETTLVQRVSDAAHWTLNTYRVWPHEPPRTESYAHAMEQWHRELAYQFRRPEYQNLHYDRDGNITSSGPERDAEGYPIGYPRAQSADRRRSDDIRLLSRRQTC